MTSTLAPQVADQASRIFECPAWCARQDCTPPDGEGIFHESIAQIVRAEVRDEDLVDVSVSIERFVDEAGTGTPDLVRIGVPAEVGEPFKFSEVIFLTPARARRLSRLLAEQAALLDGDLA